MYTFGHAGRIFSLPYCSSLKLHSFNRFRYHLAYHWLDLNHSVLPSRYLYFFLVFVTSCYSVQVTDGGLSHLESLRNE